MRAEKAEGGTRDGTVKQWRPGDGLVECNKDDKPTMRCNAMENAAIRTLVLLAAMLAYERPCRRQRRNFWTTGETEHSTSVRRVRSNAVLVLVRTSSMDWGVIGGNATTVRSIGVKYKHVEATSDLNYHPHSLLCGG